jgi:hypothetical protein
VCQTSTFMSEDARFCISDDSMHFSKKDFGKSDWKEISNVKTELGNGQ